MKRFKTLVLLSIAVLFVGFPRIAKPQTADETIGNLINAGNWFSLDEEYTKLKDEMQSEMLKNYAQVMIGYYFNQPNKAIESIDWLLANAQEEIGFDNTCTMILLKGVILGRQGFYAEGADVLNGFLEQIKDYVDLSLFPSHLEAAKFYDELRNNAKQEVIRPNKNTEIPITIEEISLGQLIFVPVTINGKKYKFIFDTGASTTHVSKRFADKAGIRILDSLAIGGIGAMRGTVDSMVIGDIVFKNPYITIGLPNEEIDTVFMLDAILGLDFMHLLGEVQIYPKEEKIVFPVSKTPLPATGRNLLFTGSMASIGYVHLKAFSKDEELLLHFDTGCALADLYDTYYAKHKTEVESTGVKKTAGRGGFDGIRYIDAYEISDFPLTVGNCNSEMDTITVLTGNYGILQSNEDGILGMDFIALFNKVVLNLDSMFLKVEK